jgi:hypothetical protein
LAYGNRKTTNYSRFFSWPYIGYSIHTGQAIPGLCRPRKIRCIHCGNWGFKSFEGFKIVYVLGRDPAARLSFDVRLLDKAATPSPRYKSHDLPQAIQVGAYFPNLTQRCRSGLIDPRECRLVASNIFRRVTYLRLDHPNGAYSGARSDNLKYAIIAVI